MRKHMIRTITAITTLAIASLVGCGGGGGGSGGASTKTGYFIDSPVEGLEYTSGSTTGITNGDGMFKYEEGKPVTFKIGSMVLGSVTVTNNRVFPVDLVSGATDERHLNVSLMAQILQTLDSGGNISERISINENTRRAFTEAINLATVNIANNSPTPSEVGNALTTLNLQLTDADQAKRHLSSNLLEEYFGRWIGTYSDGDTGTCDITIGRPATTSISNISFSGSCNSTQPGVGTEGIGTLTNATLRTNGVFSGTLSNGAVFSGQFSRKGVMTGTWTNSSFASPLTGTWTMTKQPSSN